MKFNLLPFALATLTIIASCSKEVKPDDESLQVRIDSVVWQQGNNYSVYSSIEGEEDSRILKQGVVRAFNQNVIPDINNSNRTLHSTSEAKFSTDLPFFGSIQGEVIRSVVITDRGVYYSQLDTVYQPQYYTVPTSMGTYQITKSTVNNNFAQYSSNNGDFSAKSTTDGASNTANALAAGAIGGAVNFCAGLTLNNKSDWYLPAEDELEAILADPANVPDISFIDYWTSTEVDDFSATSLDLNFFGTNKETRFKANLVRFRCVRKN